MQSSVIKTFLVSALLSFCIAASAQSGKNNESYYFQKGLEACDNNDFISAISYLEKEVALHKDNTIALTILARVYFEVDRYEEAISSVNSSLKKINKKDKDFLSDTYCLRASIYDELGEDDKALADFAQAIKIAPENPTPYEKRALLYYEHEQYDLSEKDFLQAQKLNPSKLSIYMGLGSTYMDRGEYEKAIQQYYYLTKLYPDYVAAYSYKAKAEAHMQNWNDFADDVVKALSLDNSDIPSFAMMQQNASEAYPFLVVKLKKQAVLEPDLSLWPFCIGVVNQNAKKYETAIDYFKQALKFAPDDIVANRICGCYAQLGDWDKSIEYIDQAIAVDSTFAGYRLTKANNEYSAGRVDEAIVDISKYIAMEPGDSEGYFRRGWFKEHNGDEDGAISDYSESISLDYKNAFTYQARGVLYKKAGKMDEANADFERVLQLDTLVDNISCRQYALFYLGREEEAFEWMQKMLDEDAQINYYDAACLYSLAGKKDEAVEYLRKAFELGGFRDIAHLKMDRDLDNIRDMASYKALLEKYDNH